MESAKSITKLIETAKQDAIKLAKDLAALLGELKPHGLDVAITNDKEFKALIVKFGGTTEAPAPVKATRAARGSKKTTKGGNSVGNAKPAGKRGGQSEGILAALAAKPLTTGEIGAAIGYKGANLSAVLAGIKKANKIDKDKDKKWYVIKK